MNETGGYALHVLHRNGITTTCRQHSPKEWSLRKQKCLLFLHKYMYLSKNYKSPINPSKVSWFPSIKVIQIFNNQKQK